jgi:hypothetical protein
MFLGRLLKFAWLFPALCYAAVTVRLGYLFFVSVNTDVVLAYFMFSLPSSFAAARISEWGSMLIWHEVNPATDFFMIFLFGLAQYMLLGILVTRWFRRIFGLRKAQP